MSQTALPARSAPIVGPAAGLALTFAGLFVLLALRHPGMPFNAEFWGEDGWVWYPDAYTYGWTRLFTPTGGYLQTVSRLIGILAQPVPLRWAPAVFATAALAGQAAVATMLVSSRMAVAWPSLAGRVAFALIYIALPNSWEVYGNATNLQWHLAVLAFLVLVSARPQEWSGWAWDVASLVVAGLSGPFCIMLLPVAAWEVWSRRDRVAFWRAGIVALTVCAQLAAMLVSAGHHGRVAGVLGARPGLFAKFMSMQLFLGPVLGEHWMHRYVTWHAWTDGAIPVAVLVAGSALSAVALWRGPPLLRKACAYGALVLAAGLLNPNLHPKAWPALAIPATGARYFVLPALAWIGVLFALAADRSRTLRLAGAALLLILALNLPGDWLYPTLPPTGFQQQARAFERAPPGTVMQLGMNPYVQVMTLTRR